jgi:peptidoglycan/xylan/chitin deacetylase (PgdA/CDA1 family)
VSQGPLALSFDDGPSRWTPEILELLACHAVHATFFLIGSLADRSPELVRRIRHEGHEIGNHTWSHPSLARDCDDDRIREELTRAGDCLERITGVRPTLFRAPHHDHDERVYALAAELGLRHARSDLAPPDWHPRATPGLIATFLLRGAAPGLVVELHDGVPPAEIAAEVTRRPTVQALKFVLPRFAQQGLKCVPVSEVLAA